LLRNPGVPGRHWVNFELSGTKSNRLAIGARVKLVAGEITQTDEIHSGRSYLSQNDLTRTLRVGGRIDSVEVRWPSGAVVTLKDLQPDKFYPVLEGKGVVPREQILPAKSPVNPKKTLSSERSRGTLCSPPLKPPPTALPLPTPLRRQSRHPPHSRR
jgi:hypothetical protein